MKPESIEVWAIIDIQKEPRFTYRLIDGKKSGMAIFFRKPEIPKGFKRLKRVIKVIVTPK